MPLLTLASSLVTLAQDADDDGRNAVPMLPRPPVLTHYLVESPWVVLAALTILGVLAFFVLNAKAKAKEGMLTLGVCVALAGAVWITATLVVTERERLAERTRVLINATAEAQLAELRSMLAENAQVRLNGVLFRSSRQSILDDVDRVLAKQYPVRELGVAEPFAVVDGPNSARTQVRVRARVDNTMYDTPIGSWWRIEWRRNLSPTGEGEGEWTVIGLDMLQIDFFGDPSKLRP